MVTGYHTRNNNISMNQNSIYKIETDSETDRIIWLKKVMVGMSGGVDSAPLPHCFWIRDMMSTE